MSPPPPLDLARREAGFDALYRSDPDPWDFETSAYERAKYDATLAALRARRFTHAIEIGCSIGLLTQRLADVAERVTGVDVSSVALERARERVPTARFVHADVPDGWPEGPYDLVVLSEVLYFLEPDEIRRLARLVRRDTVPGAPASRWTGSANATCRPTATGRPRSFTRSSRGRARPTERHATAWT